MSRLNWSQNRTRSLSIVMIAVAALLLVDGIYQVAMHVKWRNWLQAVPVAQAATTQPAGSQPASQPTTTQASSQPTTRAAAAPPKPAEAKKPPVPREVHAAIKKRNIFVEPPQKGHFMRLTGVIGKTALFAGRDGNTVGIEEGQSASGIKVTSIKDYEVVIEYQGKPETMRLFEDAGGRPSGPEGPRPPGVENMRPPGADNSMRELRRSRR